MSNTPLTVDVPHQLGAEEARRRIDGKIGTLKDHIPVAADVRAAWQGDRLGLQVAAMGQEVNAVLDVRDTFVRVEVLLPPALGFFGKAIELALKRGGAALLEDKSGSRG
ncbi:polyhydroxyalkanoic acid system family protein [Sphingosinicella sp. LHD-64]|uniref:polyhydroxyalkanoic acid system family protein n=1 Tax=Sphingosinicella sp. LHD-64 TaxID=3072139 RepID=UPI00280E1B7C|nr:polyhydroxyalkanoic acid system family protein [Sphingosinicella sp. LHD-64]MDQ8757097.1 polyhydroxyalkanoic acid system family protein [Sphingosinicella sp. LHD-64]